MSVTRIEHIGTTGCSTGISGVTLGVVPTTRPRHLVPETDEVIRALAAAKKRWPADADRPARLLARLVDIGGQVLDEHEHQSIEDRRDALNRTSGTLTGVYDPQYLTELREDWSD